MEIKRCMEILDDWAKWMKVDSHKLYYPSKSSFFSSGGESSNEIFDQMLEDMDVKNAMTMDAIIDSLPKNQKQAIYARYLREKKSKFYEYDLGLAMDNILTIATRRINA